jgi:hypothetical protein
LIDAKARNLRKSDNADGWERRREELKERLDRSGGRAGSAYKALIERCLGFADRVFGPNERSSPAQWRTFDRCLLVAFVYPMLLFVLGWVTGGSGVSGVAGSGISMFPEAPVQQRLLIAFIAIAITVGLYFFV